MTAPTPILEMEGVSKRFPGVVALDRVSLSVGTAEILALIGENGAGKSTLMKILGGVTARDTGSIKIDGEPVEIASPREASARRIEFIHQELSVLDNLDVAANIFLRREPTKGGLLKLVDRKRIYRESDEILRRLGLSGADLAAQVNAQLQWEANNLIHSSVRAGRNPAELAREFQCSVQTIRNWVGQAAADAVKPRASREVLPTAERGELAR